MFNKVSILGTMTRDVEIRNTPSGAVIGNFGIALNEKRKDKTGNYVEKAHFFDVVTFGSTAENISKFFRKGSRILIDGSLDFQQWQDKATGEKKSKVGIKLNSFEFIDRKSDNQGQNQQQQQKGSYEVVREPYQQQQPQQNYNSSNATNGDGILF